MAQPAKSFSVADEPRRAPRSRTRLAAKIIFGEAMRIVECVVRDWSDLGVKIEMPVAADLPERLWLLDQRFPLAHEVRLIWRRGRFAGLELADAIDHHDAHPHVRVLRRLRRA
ncbi:MAG TPA: hypothetical protein VFC47_03020 [Caulobacteraceae bacterium]|nr:hypothetical protein [Caulobacteraceae bacterium]